MVSGTVSDYGPAEVRTLERQFAVSANVPPSLVSITVAAASVRLTVRISATTTAQAASAASALNTTFANPAAATAVLQAVVPSIIVVSMSAPDILNPASSSAVSIGVVVGSVVGGLAVALLLALGVMLYMRRRRGGGAPGLVYAAARGGTRGGKVASTVAPAEPAKVTAHSTSCVAPGPGGDLKQAWG